MRKLSEIMTRDVVTVTPQNSLRDVVTILVDSHITGVPVLAGSQVVGVISAADILEFEATTPPVPAERPFQAEWGGWEEVEEREYDDEDPATFFSDMWSDVGADLMDRFGGVTAPEWDLLTEYTVADAMTSKLCALPPQATVQEAAAYMRRAAIHRVLVMEDGRLLGIVTATDIVGAVAESRI